MNGTDLPRGVLSRTLSGGFFFVAIAPLGAITAVVASFQNRVAGIAGASLVAMWAVLQLGSTARWLPATRNVRLGMGPFCVSRHVPPGAEVVVIPKAAYKGAPWNGIGYFPDSPQPVVEPMPVYLPGSGWLGDRRRTRWLQQINRSVPSHRSDEVTREGSENPSRRP